MEGATPKDVKVNGARQLDVTTELLNEAAARLWAVLEEERERKRKKELEV